MTFGFTVRTNHLGLPGMVMLDASRVMEAIVWGNIAEVVLLEARSRSRTSLGKRFSSGQWGVISTNRHLESNKDVGGVVRCRREGVVQEEGEAASGGDVSGAPAVWKIARLP